MRSPVVIVGLLFIALCHPSAAQELEERVVRVAEGEPLTVECPLRVEQRAQWRRDGGALPADLRPAGEAAAPGSGGGARAVTARLHASAARSHHAGVYTCARGADAARVRVLVQARAAAAPARPSASASAPGTEAAAAAAAAAPAPAPVTASPEDQPPEWLDYVYELHRAIELSCKPGGNAAVPADLAYTWKVNGTELSGAASLAGRHELREGGAVLAVARSTEEDWGNYTCLVGGEAARGYRVGAFPVLRLPSDSNVVEGQKLKLVCRVLGRPFPALTWTYTPSADVNETDVLTALGERVRLEDGAGGAPGAVLVLEPAQRTDAGVFRCRAPEAALPSAPASTAEPTPPPAAATLLRVKDMYAALWPFLGICAEVFILCAIILVYEKRRTKPELDDSDTDNHDQKKS